LKGANELLTSAVVNLLGGSSFPAINKNAETLLGTSTEDRLDLNAGRNKNMYSCIVTRMQDKIVI
jgi:hypothetical protein